MEKLITAEVEQTTELEAESIEQVTELEATYELSGGIIPTGTKQINITSNGTTTEDVTNYADAEITVNVQGGITPTGTKQITIDSSGTTTEDVTNYASAEITVPSGSASTPSTSITANPTISVSSSGLITASASASQSVTPTVSEGWVSSGSAGTISVSGSNTSQLSTQGATTITPTTSQQTAVASGKYTTGNVVVDPIPSQYIIPSGTKSITANGTGIDVTQYASVDVAVSGGSANIKTGTFTVASDSQGSTPIEIVHNAGFVPKLVVVWTEAYTSSSPPSGNTNIGFVYAPNFVDFPQRLSSSVSSTHGIYIPWVVAANGAVVNSATTTSTSYMPTSASEPTSTSFFLIKQTNNYYWRSGITYKYFLTDATTMGWGS